MTDRRGQAERMREDFAEARDRALAATRTTYTVLGVGMLVLALALFTLGATATPPRSPIIPVAVGTLLVALGAGFVAYARSIVANRHLVASGVEARARVVETLGMSSTALRIRGAGLMTSVLRKTKFRLEIMAPDQEPYEVTYEDFVPNAFSHDPNQTLVAWVDPKRREKVYVDWSSGA